MTYRVRAARTMLVAAATTLAAWWLIRGLHTLIDGATEADSARNPLAGAPYYLAANAAGIVFQPLALWIVLRLAKVRGSLLAIIISAFVWATMATGHLVDSPPGPAGAVLWVTIQCVTTTGASLLQARLLPAGTRLKQQSP
ncbi:hypothetical protein ACQB60_44880 [Actinomycetota bacterium Odt1-20B]